MHPERLYLLTRDDLRRGVQASMLVHAAINLCLRAPDELLHWHRTSNTIVLVSTENEAHLEAMVRRADAQGLPGVSFLEPDLGGQLASLALPPGDAARKLCRGLPLAR